MAKIFRIAERRWVRMRSEHARTLAGLERARRAHPAGGRRAPARPAPHPPTVTRVPRDDNSPDAA